MTAHRDPWRSKFVHLVYDNPTRSGTRRRYKGLLDAIRVGSGAVRWRETESPGGHGWLPRCICSEPAYPMCVHWESGEGALRPPSNPHCRAPESGSRESGRRRPRSILPVR